MKPTKVLDYKTYNSIGHLSGSRLGASDSKIDAKTEKCLTVMLPEHMKCFLYIEEKMDGTNVCVVRLHGELRVLSRSGYDCKESPQKQHQMFYRWVMANKEKFNKLLTNNHDRVVGEWLAQAHGTIYNGLSNPFQVFDLYHEKRQLPVSLRTKLVEQAGLVNVPIVLAGLTAVPIDVALSCVNKNAEGVVYRLEKMKKNATVMENTPWIIAKVVRMEKEDGKYLTDPNLSVWNWRESNDLS
jgi:ATP-dependent RNA circularization protein (DNA/RNA ligase family)